MEPLGTVAKFSRVLLDSRIAAPLRHLLFLREVRREQGRARRDTENLLRSGKAITSWENVVSQKNGILFVLGSGPSIADLGEEDFAFFSRGFSIGINTWVLHPFIPDAYTYEFDPDSRLLGFLNREAVSGVKPKVLMLRPRGPHEHDHYLRLPHHLRDSSVIHGRVNLMTRKSENIWKDFYRSVEWLRRNPHVRVLPDNGATVARIVSLGVLNQFRRIVLVGVDLIGTEYFWDKDPRLISHLGISGWGTGQSGLQHETLNSGTRPFPIDEWLFAVGKGLSEQGISLEIWSSKSRLAQRLRVSPESRH